MPSSRLLLLSAPDTGVLDLLTDLTGSAPTPTSASGSCAGLTHSWDVQTAYYSATIPIWIDEIANPQAWESEFKLPEAKEVVEAVGAWAYVFRLPVGTEDVEGRLRAVREVLEAHGAGGGYGSGGVMLAVFLPPRSGSGKAVLLEEDVKADMDDVCMQFGFESVEFAATGLNAFGEKQGLERVREALEANEWTSLGDDDEDEDGGLGFEDGFGAEEAEMNAELFGMKASLLSSGFDNDGDEDDAEALAKDLSADRQAGQVDDLEAMMSKLLAVREQSAELPEAQRKRMAAKAVREIMGE